MHALHIHKYINNLLVTLFTDGLGEFNMLEYASAGVDDHPFSLILINMIPIGSKFTNFFTIFACFLFVTTIKIAQTTLKEGMTTTLSQHTPQN